MNSKYMYYYNLLDIFFFLIFFIFELMDSFLIDFKNTIGLSDEVLTMITNIILNDNLSCKKENFKKFLSLDNDKNNNIEKEKILFCYILLYILDVHREFKNDLSILLKKKINDFNEEISKFFKLIRIDLLNKEVTCLKFKVLMLNNLYDISKKGIKEDLKKKFFEIFSNCIINNEVNILLNNLNDEIGMIIAFFFNCFNNIINSFSVIENQLLIKLKDIVYNDLIINIIPYNKKTKDMIFILSNFLFNLILKINNEEFNKNCFEFLSKFSKHQNYENLFVYMKGYYNNCKYDNLKCLKEEKLYFLNEFIKEKILKLNEEKKDLSLLDFYMLFISHDTNGKYSIIINDMFLIALTKTLLNKENEIQLKKIFEENKIIKQFIIKIERDKENFGFIEDNFFSILNILYTKFNFQNEINNYIDNYFLKIINSKIKPLLNEGYLFQYLSNINFETRKKFLEYIFSYDFNKKDIQLINEYTKIFFDYCKKNDIDNEHKLFINSYPNFLLSYLKKTPIKYLRLFNSFFVSIEKNNPIYYILLIQEAYKELYDNQNIDSTYGIFFALLRPYRNHKKNLFIKDKIIHISYSKKNIDLKIPIENLKQISITNNEYLTLEIMEFINEFDEKNEIFIIVYKIIKYNLKTDNAEYKSGLFKSLKVYFEGYFNQINKMIVKKKFDEKYIETAFNNYIKLLYFLNDNIYDRPVENLQTYLDLLHYLCNLIENLSFIKNEKVDNFYKNYSEIIYNKGLCISLISLLKHSWFDVRFISFEILKQKQFKNEINNMKNELILEIEKYAFSLREMDCEGSAYLFMLLVYHLGFDLLKNAMIKIFNNSIEKNDNNIINLIILNFQKIINNKVDDYMESLNNKNIQKNIFDIKNKSLHTYFIFIKNILDLEKSNIILNSKEENKTSSNETTLSLLFSLSHDIISLNSKFLIYLINNGVSEFTLDNDMELNNNIISDHEDKILISLWNTSKFSLNTLSLIYEIFYSNYPIIYSSLNQKENSFENYFLKPLSNSLNEIIPILITSKHMGVVKAMNEVLLKITILLNKSNDPYIKYREICKNKIIDFISNQITNHEISSTLRRSAGIPYLIVTLIKSYISPSYSNQYIIDILKFTIDNLLNNFNKYQNNKIDASVHCLQILRAISEDTLIKPYVRVFYNDIIMKIIDGLESENWSIKNACMFMFSRVIKNNFFMQNKKEMERVLPTFCEYFLDKKDFFKIVVQILEKNIINGNKINDCLLLFITFFTKFRIAKPNDYENENGIKVIKLLLNLDKKDNKLFRKLLTNAILKLYGANYNKLINDILIRLDNIEVNDLIEFNNKIDFYYNSINEIIKNNEIEVNEKKGLLKKYKEKIKMNINYLGLSKYIQLIKKINTSNENDIKDLFNYSIIGFNLEEKKIYFDKLFEQLNLNSRKFSYFKFIKHSINFFLINLNYSINYTNNFIQYFDNKKLEELIVYLFKKFPNKLDILILNPIKNLNLNNYSVNISHRISVFLSKKQNLSKLSKDEKKFLFDQLVKIMKENKGKTKLLNKTFILLPLLIEDNYNEINTVLDLIYLYSLADNLDKLRIGAILAFEHIIYSFSLLDEKIDNFKILLISFLLMNDEISLIRKKACDIFIEYNKKKKIISKDFKYSFTNEYLNKKLLIQGNINFDFYKKFIDYIENTNFYFRRNILDTKVFYYEPDNRYIDNIESKLYIIRNKLRNKIKEDKKESKYSKIKIMFVLEEFADCIKEKLFEIYENSKGKDIKYIFKDQTRKILYNDI